jgi:flagellar hook-length control protein FliK
LIAYCIYKQAKRQRNDVGVNDMAQAILLKTESISTSNSSQNIIKNKVGETKGESFSSALDKQIDKQEPQQHKETNKADSKQIKSVDNDKNKADSPGDKSGKSLPDKAAETTEKIDEIDEGDIVIVDTDPIIATEGSESDIISDDPLATVSIADELIQEGLITAEDLATVNLAGDTAVIKKQMIEATKGELTETSKAVIDANSSKKIVTESADKQMLNKDTILEQKQLVTNLRSDILNALVKKPTTVNEKSASVIEQKSVSAIEQKLVSTIEQQLVTSPTLVPIAKEGLTEEQKIMALSNMVKSKGLASTAIIPERTTVGSAGFSPAITSTNAPVTAVMSAGQPTLDLQPGLKSEAWSRVLSSRVIWMAREGVQQASLKLNPVNMGPVEVKLHMHNEQANISFIAQHAATRDALEQALPRLRESFQENGMELAHADVSQQDFSEADEQDNNTNNNGLISGESNTDEDIDNNDNETLITEQELDLGLSVFA